MLRLSLVLFLFLSFFSMACHLQNKKPSAESATPETTSGDTDSYDFGQVREGEVLRHRFILKNHSAKILNIKEVNTSCGCTVSWVEKKRLLPGEATAIEVKFETKGYSGLTQQYIYVHTDSLDNPILRFIIKAKVIK